MDLAVSQWAQVFCGLSFFIYGYRCVFTDKMVAEFARYGMPRFRVLTGSLQLLAVLGLIVGNFLPILGFFAAIGLSIQMLFALVVRIRIGDSFLRCLPATFYMFLCSWIAYLTF